MNGNQHSQHGDQCIGRQENKGDLGSQLPQKKTQWMLPSAQESRAGITVGSSFSQDQEMKNLHNIHFDQRLLPNSLSKDKPVIRSSGRMSINRVQRRDSPGKVNYGLATLPQIQRAASTSTSISEKTVRTGVSVDNNAQASLNVSHETIPESESSKLHPTPKLAEFSTWTANACEVTSEAFPTPSGSSFTSKEAKISTATTKTCELTNREILSPPVSVKVKNDPHTETADLPQFSCQIPIPDFTLTNLWPMEPSLQKPTKEYTPTTSPWGVTFNCEDPPIHPPFPVSKKLLNLLDAIYNFRYLINKYVMLPKEIAVGKIYLVKHPQSERFYRGRVLQIEGNQLLVLLTDFLSVFLTEKHDLCEYPHVLEWMLHPDY